jgi:hypothetical protein
MRIGTVKRVTHKASCGTIGIGSRRKAILISPETRAGGPDYLITDGAGRTVGSGRIVRSACPLGDVIILHFTAPDFAGDEPNATMRRPVGHRPCDRTWEIARDERALAA